MGSAVCLSFYKGYKMKMSANSIFRRFVKGDKNLFSPNIISYDHSNANHDYVYELSWGDAIFGGYLVGVTVVNIFNGSRHDLSQSFTGPDRDKVIAEALNYANQLGAKNDDN
jgi:hypothetical protein